MGQGCEALSTGAPLPGRWLLLVAHQDDEVIAASRILVAAPHVTLAHATDGVTPRDASARSLGATRDAELAAALDALGCAPERIGFGLPDGGLVEHLAALTAGLVQRLDRFDVVVTHAFEGGHPDHDARAVALDAACRRVRTAPLRLEFPIYAREGESARLLAFPSASRDGLKLPLDETAQARKISALAAFASQRHVVERFPTDREALRRAALLKVEAPRDPATLLWARGDRQLEERWRKAAMAAVAQPSEEINNSVPSQPRSQRAE